MIALLVPEISPGVGFCDEDEDELGILVVGYEKDRSLKTWSPSFISLISHIGFV